MHIEKNVFDNAFNIVIKIKGKTKDNVKPRLSLAIYCKCPHLELHQDGIGRVYKNLRPPTVWLKNKKMIFGIRLRS